MMKKFVAFLFSITCSVLMFSQTAGKVDGLGLHNLYKVDHGIYRSEQPNSKQFIALEKYGIKEILNLRAWHSDSKHAKGTDLVLRRVRMHAHHANDYDVVAALRIIKERKGAILIHCHHGSDRTGLVVAMYKIIFMNMTKKEAIAEMTGKEFGFHSIYSNILQYINNVDIDIIKKQLDLP